MGADFGRREGAGGQDGTFGGLDPKLNVYALANGMDLEREASLRKLLWYRDGLERAILIEEGPGATLSVFALSWSTGDPASLRRAPEREGIPADELARNLSSVLDAALERANRL